VTLPCLKKLNILRIFAQLYTKLKQKKYKREFLACSCLSCQQQL